MKKLLLLALLVVFSCSKDEPPRYLLSVSASLGGAVSTTGGDYAEGKSVTITATANPEYQFVNWSNGSTQNPLTVTVMADQVLSANFVKVKYGLTLSTEGEGTVAEELISSGRVDYNSGSLVRLTATPAVGYSFTGWSGDVTSTSNPVEVDITSAKSITAVFDLIVVSLQVDIQGEGDVLEETVTDRSTDYSYGDTVKLTAQPGEGSDFISWSGDIGELDPTQNPLELTLTESKTIQANFDYELFNRIVGKWKIRKKADDKLPSWYMHSIIFRRNYSYTINSNVGQVNGVFDVKSNTEIELEDYGSISNVDITPSVVTSTSPWSNFNFNISVSSEQFEGLIESDVVENYQSETSETGEIIEKTYVPDDNFEQALIDLGYDDELDDYVLTSNINQVTVLEVSEKNISDLTGIEDFISLTSLQADNMELSELDVSNNIYLTNLSVHSNNLTELDLGNNVNLTDLIINDNEISSIDLSNNVNLTSVNVHHNNLTELDLENNILLYSLNVNYNSLTTINLSSNSNLTWLYLSRNTGLTSLDLSNNINLMIFELMGNQITSIDLSKNVNLTDLYLNGNQFTSFDVSNNPKLKYLYLDDSSLTSLDISNLIELFSLHITSNQIFEIDVSNSPLLTVLKTTENPNLNCIKVSSDQLANIPSEWIKDESTEYSLDCIIICDISVSLTSGSANQTLTAGSAITTNQYTLSSTCSDAVTYSPSASGLPTGVSLSITNNTASLSGTPTAAGTYNYSLTVSGSTSSNASITSVVVSGIITVNEVCDISVSLTNGSANQTVTAGSAITTNQYTLSSTCSDAVIYSVSASGLPAGVISSISNNTASISGTPTTAGTYNYNLIVSGSTSSNASITSEAVSGIITVNEVCALSVIVTSGSASQTTTIGSPITPTEITLSSTCLDTTYTMSYVDNSVPGLIVSFTDNTINLSGAPALEGTFDYSILVESTNLTYNQTSSTTLNGTITSNPPSLSTTLTSGPQSQTVTTTNSITNVVYTFSTNYTGPVNAQASNLPPGISLSFSNNVATLSGTATTSGTYNYSITVSVGSTNSLVNGTITITPSPIYLENGICKCPSASAGDTQAINGTTYTAVNNSTIAGQISGSNYNLCTTLVTDMSSLFAGNSSFNSNIGFWDTSNVTTMGDLFQSADSFNQDISGWDVSNVTNMNNMFKYARRFNQNIGSWDVSSVTTMSVMFTEADDFNQDISGWNVTNVNNMFAMFNSADDFNQDLTGWCVSNISSVPSQFSTGSELTDTNKPIWGTCD